MITLTTVGDWQKRLGDAFGGDPVVGPNLLEIIGGEAATGILAAHNFEGFFTLSSAFQSFYLESLRVLERRLALPNFRWYWPIVFTHIATFKLFRSAETLFLRGYPLVGHSLFRDVRDRAFMLAAVARGLLTFQEANGYQPAASEKLTRSEARAAVNARKTADRKIAKDTIGSNSGFSADQQEMLESWTQLFHLEIHGSRLTFALDLGNWLEVGGSLPLTPTAPDGRPAAVYLTRFEEVAWMTTRLLPLLQIKPGEFGDNWEKRWRVLDESFEQALGGRNGSAGEFAQIVCELLTRKFPFSPTATAYAE